MGAGGSVNVNTSDSELQAALSSLDECDRIKLRTALEAANAIPNPARQPLETIVQQTSTLQKDAPSVTVIPSKSIVDDEEDVVVMLRISPPQVEKRASVDICCVIDVSGSMDDEARIQGSTGTAESHGLTLLDVAKHGVRTIAHTLGPDDRLALIAFNHNATIVFDLKAMDEDGQKYADSDIDKLLAGGGTRLWQGLQAGFDVLRNTTSVGRMGHIMLLTDGKADDKIEVWPSFEAYVEEHKTLPCTVSTFGFGYKLDSDLLSQIAGKCDGCFSFIPDAGFVGTCFVNTISNLLVTMARRATLHIEPKNQARVNRILGGYALPGLAGEQLSVEVGTLQYGQTKDVVLQMRIEGASKRGMPYLQSTLWFTDLSGERTSTSCASALSAEKVADDVAALVEPQVLRSCFVAALDEVMSITTVKETYVAEQVACMTSYLTFSDGDSLLPGDKVTVSKFHEREEVEVVVHEVRGQSAFRVKVTKDLIGTDLDGKRSRAEAVIKQCVQTVSNSTAAGHEFVKALLEDVAGQSSQAVGRTDWLWKWGLHYMRSLQFAHKYQQCNNFKDPGVQHYGGELFHEMQDSADDNFNKLLAPKPTAKSVQKQTPSGAPAQPLAPVNMAAFNDACAG